MTFDKLIFGTLVRLDPT